MNKRILLKLSGEALAPKEDRHTLDVTCIHNMAQTIKALHEEGFQIGVVIGAGNIWRGKLADQIGIERVPADFMGMLGTVVNCVALSSALKKIGIESVVFSALHAIDGVCLDYDKEEAKKSLEEGKICFFAGGTGKPYFTTDTAAALRAVETDCDTIYMGKFGTNGVYDKDPNKFDDAKFFSSLTYEEMIDMKLCVMDQSAVELIKETNIVTRVFAMNDYNNFLKVASGENIGTTIRR